jgi:hypothetical protein
VVLLRITVTRYGAWSQDLLIGFYLFRSNVNKSNFDGIYICIIVVLCIAIIVLLVMGKQVTGNVVPTQSPLSAILSLATVQESDTPPVTASPTYISTDNRMLIAVPTPTTKPTTILIPTLFVLAPLFDSTMDITAKPISIPLVFQIPLLNVNAPMLGVGLTSNNAMDAPMGKADDPVWRMAFWYRGSGVPGNPGVATIAGHVDDILGRPAIFAHLQQLKPGNLIIIHDQRTTTNIDFSVDRIVIYQNKELSNPMILTQIFGAGPVAGTGPQPASDGLSHLVLVTCTGHFINGEYDHRVIVYATRKD